MTVDEIVHRIRERSERLASGLPVSQPPLGSDFSLNGVIPQPESYRAASVLIPLVNHAEGLAVLLTQRTDDMPSHAGQIAFPGGRQQAEDSDAVATALRETEEEVGLAADRIEILGELADYETVTGYRVTPVVGWVEPPFTLATDPIEVAEAFEVPLAFVLDPANQQRHYRMLGELRRDFWAIPWRDRYIWGATAAMLLILDRTLRAD